MHYNHMYNQNDLSTITVFPNILVTHYIKYGNMQIHINILCLCNCSCKRKMLKSYLVINMLQRLVRKMKVETSKGFLECIHQVTKKETIKEVNTL